MNNPLTLWDMLFALVVVCAFLLVLWIFSRLQSRPEERIVATVIRKQSKADLMNFTAYRAIHNTIVFVDTDGKKHRFKMNDALFTRIPDHQKGILTCQGSRFVCFESENVRYQ